MEVIDMYNNCPGKEWLNKIIIDIENIHRRIDKKDTETKEEFSMIETTINKNHKETMEAVEKLTAKGNSTIIKVLTFIVISLLGLTGTAFGMLLFGG